MEKARDCGLFVNCSLYISTGAGDVIQWYPWVVTCVVHDLTGMQVKILGLNMDKYTDIVVI